MENQHCDVEADRWAQGLGGPQVGLAYPTWWPLGVCFYGEPPGVFYNLPMSVMLWNYVISFDE